MSNAGINRGRAWGAPIVAMMESLLGSAAQPSRHITAPRVFERHQRSRSYTHRKGRSGDKHRRHAAERRFGLSSRGY